MREGRDLLISSSLFENEIFGVRKEQSSMLLFLIHDI
ncbi:hypothetical protein A943_14185 [Bacillus sp. CPSM8]|nr:hypothetical protein A943_14185 [Bacillus sp. CPSM8]KUL14369.1 hypothetical protein LI7559_04300 [Bacillus licheniformis LMG 7559]KUL19615.1 hypothetical protein LI6934_00945 [Bacillus licheniformis LMG 6934]BCE04734.1 hypothetical protein RSC1_00891 [Bacillus paralicheniformis]BCE10936.1 hypothetical protein RSC2_02732 [Bacillus paralicheniformis]